MEHHIFVVSDGTGETATKMAKAALTQFRSANTVVTRRGNVRNLDQVREVVREAEKDRALVIHTIAAAELRRELEQACEDHSVPSHNLLGPLLERLERVLGTPPSGKPGLLHQIDDDYFERLDALAFTVRYDDNPTREALHEADVILVGLSRTSKTPLSIYLAQEGWKVANLPLVLGRELPPELSEVEPSKVVGLITTPDRLAAVRRARLSRLGSQDSTYADAAHIAEELRYCREIFSGNPTWLQVDVSSKSVEEAAAEIQERLHLKERRL